MGVTMLERDRAGILAKVDLGILAAYATALATLDKAETMLAEGGYIQITESGEKKSSLGFDRQGSKRPDPGAWFGVGRYRVQPGANQGRDEAKGRSL
jgi:hypothetical protein